MRTVRILALAGVAATVVVAPARAQLAGKFVVTPYVGAYMPSADLARFPFLGRPDLAAKHQSAAAFGANASYWLNGRMALEGGLLYSASSLKGTLVGTEIGPTTMLPRQLPGLASTETDHANVWLGSAKLMVQVLPPESHFNMRFGIGPAIITRSGSAYESEPGTKITGLTDLGAAMSLCTRFALTPSAAVRLRLENYMYKANLGLERTVDPAVNYTFGNRTQNDFVISVGFQLFLNP